MADTPADILRALADPERLAITGHLARSSANAATLAEAVELPLARVRKHLNRLTSAGVVRVRDDGRRIGSTPRRSAGRPSRWDRPAMPASLGAASDDEESVLRAFFRDGRLTEIPAKEAKRRIVLERIALEFEPGAEYEERAVNAIVGRFSPDHAALRRYLVDEGFLGRDHGRYWRSGGRVDVLSRPADRYSAPGAVCGPVRLGPNGGGRTWRQERSWGVNAHSTSATIAVREERPIAKTDFTRTAFAGTEQVAFEDFFQAERTRLFRALCLMTGDPCEAEELAQDAFLHLWERWDRVRSMEHPAGYLYRSAMNGFRSERRRLARAARTALAPECPVDAYEAADLRDTVVRALACLGRRQRAAVVLTDLLGYRSAEAGRLLGVEATTVRSLVAEARSILRTQLEQGDA